MEISSLSSDAQEKSDRVDAVNKDDRISKLSDHLLAKILSGLSFKEAVRTSVLSTRWVDVWKERTQLRIVLSDFTTDHGVSSMGKVINDIHGPLERCTISYHSYQSRNGVVEAWIRPLIHEKLTKHLTFVNFFITFEDTEPITLNLPAESFSHPNLKSLSLGEYTFETPDAFRNCCNLKHLSLSGVFAEIGVFNVVLLSCPSLEVLVVDISCYETSGPLKIDNRNLKFLYLSCDDIDGIEVSSPNLDILTVGFLSCESYKLVIANPRLKFHRNFWSTRASASHTSYSISCPHEVEKNIGHEYMISGSREFMGNFGSLSVSVDLTNTKEVEMLREILVAWPGEMEELEILFKKSDFPIEEGDSSNGRTHKKFWEETKPFPNADFRVSTVWLNNFSGSEEEITLASRLVTQGTVIKTMIIKSYWFSPSIKLKIQEAVSKLKELPKVHTELDIKMVR